MLRLALHNLLDASTASNDPHTCKEEAGDQSTSSHLEPMRLVILSDTHNDHRALDVPAGDVLIHAGDFTCYGRQEHAEDFNAWLGELPHAHKIVVNGNHENNAPWKAQVRGLLTNAVFLKDEGVRIPRIRKDGAACCEGDALTVYGTEFFWPMQPGHRNPSYDLIPKDTQVLVTHGPVQGFVDGGSGCPAMREKCEQLAISGQQLRLVISGHVHSAYGRIQGTGVCRGVEFVNAANCDNRKIANPPIVIDL
jgi:3',5'-cyclic AMP phosphodiesterase CpdA